ncbi:MAG: NAD(P)-dependent oxidoreductase [Prevotellaceae bacterium]|jgi:UDP-glucose 4-epimerase|nr:NAD(P)-dependent oxidoreductase [Prevotellaceae bacterium]
MDTILITGASGFIGSFLVEEALRRGMNTWAGVRATSSRRYLEQPELHLLELDFSHPDVLQRQLADHRRANGPFDYIVHCAGVTKTPHVEEFDRVNNLQTRTFVDTLKALDMVPRQFAFVSTLSIYGPVHERDYRPITDADTPRPNTAYARSKLLAEQYLQAQADFPYVIYRPTGVYGPRETDYYLMAKAIKRHVDFAAGFRRQDITFIYAQDLVGAIFQGIDKGVVRHAYALTDGGVYNSRTFSRLIRRELGNPVVVRFTCPLLLLKAISLLAQTVARITGKPATLNLDKYNILKQRNWRCDITPAQTELDYKPQYPLERGVHDTIAWYKKKKWL